MLESEVAETLCRSTAVSGLDEVPGNVDAQHVGAQPRCGQRRRPVAASEVEDFHSPRDTETLDECLAAFAHALGDAREVALLPECLIRVHASLLSARARYCCTSAIAMPPSPTADATRLTGLNRTSPHAK